MISQRIRIASMATLAVWLLLPPEVSVLRRVAILVAVYFVTDIFVDVMWRV